MEKIENAIILAAGFGSRLMPLTNTVPKPLVSVHGIPMIERIIERLVEIKVKNIVIVTGHLKESFEYLIAKYKNVSLIFNKDFKISNNISSIYYARKHLSNSYVIEGDIYIQNKEIIKAHQEVTNYRAFKVSESLDWCFKINNNNKILDFFKGGSDCYQMVGISYWNNSDGKKLSKHIADCYTNMKCLNIFWDQVPLEIKKDDFYVSVVSCDSTDAVEIDTYEDLVAIDCSYTTSN